MTSFISHMKRVSGIALVCIISACTSGSVEQDITPTTTPAIPTTATQPGIPQAGISQAGIPQTANTQIAQQATPNALATPGIVTPTQNVTEAQLQQQATQQIQSGLQSQVQPQVPTQPSTQQIASLDTSKAMTFLPFEGAPSNRVNNINKFLNSSAQSNGLTIFPATRAGAKYKVKGYFSALNDGNGTLLVYVWDVTDSTGRRLHRINGRERTGTTNVDPWRAISDSELQKVAAATTSRLKSWVSKR